MAVAEEKMASLAKDLSPGAFAREAAVVFGCGCGMRYPFRFCAASWIVPFVHSECSHEYVLDDAD